MSALKTKGYALARCWQTGSRSEHNDEPPMGRHLMMNTTAATETKNHANRDESVMKHMGAVESVARSVMRRLPLDQGQIEYADLVSVGMLGLLHAFDRHDEGMERFDALVEALSLIHI